MRADQKAREITLRGDPSLPVAHLRSVRYCAHYLSVALGGNCLRLNYLPPRRSFHTRPSFRLDPDNTRTYFSSL